MNSLVVWRVANGHHPNHSDRLPMQVRKYLYRKMVSVLPGGLPGNRLGVGERIRDAGPVVPKNGSP